MIALLKRTKNLFVSACIAALFGLYSVSAMAKEICWTEGPSQFADAIHYCVSSMLHPQGRWTYGPKNLVGYYGSNGAWCEGVKGNGIEEAIMIRIDRGPGFRRLLIKNGYGKSARSFADNGRIKRVQITTDTGINTTARLIDQPGEQPVNLPSAAHNWVRLKILDIYPGARYADTCVSALRPDFEYEERLLQGKQPEPERAVPSLPHGSGEGFENVPALPETRSGAAEEKRSEASSCLSPGEAVSGRLELYQATHPAGYAMKSYHLVLASPVCVNADGERIDAVRQIQLAPSQKQRSELSSRLGDIITVRGSFKPPHTAWHTGDVVLVDVTLD